ncbi:hypothetical protein [Brucella abortus]|uniref:hypothetical protein n=1 Tax=Brucella abortus TaxID=235 RepID=UPI000B149420|nr:hypothetical protein [Brucella abortus]
MADDPQIRAIVRGIEGLTERVVTAISFNIVANLVEDTPVDTGWARANWVPAIGTSMDTPASARPDQSMVPGAVARQQAGQASLLGYRLAQGSVFISNNVPYIMRLNDGSSQQAPRGFVQAAIARGIQQTERGL